MERVLIIGGGLAGCIVASELSKAGMPSSIVEKNDKLGGKVRGYGCKSDTKCNDCGICAVGPLWHDVESDPNIEKLFEANLADLKFGDGQWNALIKTGGARSRSQYSKVVVATGFEEEREATCRPVMSGSELEHLLNRRGPNGVFEKAPESIAFIMCSGSRDVKERAAYCSRVCCAYSTRGAKVIKHYHPETEIVIYYMDLQAVNPGNYAEELKALGMKLERCRPTAVKVEDGKAVVWYEGAEGKTSRVFLNTGIHPDIEMNTALADLTGLKVNGDGFLTYVKNSEETGVYLTGCAVSPKTIRETIADARSTAAELLGSACGRCAE